MFDKIYSFFVKYPAALLVYQIGVFVAWAIWAASSLGKNEVTWLVFGWLPAVFWPVELIARIGSSDKSVWTQLQQLWQFILGLVGAA